MGEEHKTTRRAKLWWWVGGVAALVAAGLVIAAFVHVRGRRIWTDGMDLSVSRDAAAVRDVLWLRPEPMDEQFNTPGQEYEICISPDGAEMYFVRGLPGKGADLMVSHRQRGKWQEPEPVASVNTRYDELGPRLSPDGQMLLFYSNRPGGLGGYDIWAAVRHQGERWQAAVNLGPAINGPHNDYGPAMDADGGRLFFSTNRKAAEAAGGSLRWKATIRQGEIGDYDLFVADLVAAPAAPAASRPADAATSRPAASRPASPALPFTAAGAVEVAGVNTSHHEGTPCVSPAGDFLYFASNRPGGSGGFDLYRVRITAEDWPAPENLGPQVNTEANETDPQLVDGGFRMYFSSDRDNDDSPEANYNLYVTTSREVYNDRRGQPLPQLGWSVWVFLGALVLLIPLLLFLKAGGYKHLSTLQKCAVASLLLHVLLTLMFSLHEMSRKIITYVRDAGGMEVAVNLDLASRVNVTAALRDQISKLPPTDMPPASIERSRAFHSPRAPRPEAVNLPEITLPADRALPPTHVVRIVTPPMPPTRTESFELPPPSLDTPPPIPKLAFAASPVIAPEDRPRADPARPKPVAPRPTPMPETDAAGEVRATDPAPMPPTELPVEPIEPSRPIARSVPQKTVLTVKDDHVPLGPIVPVFDVSSSRADDTEQVMPDPSMARRPNPTRRRSTTMPATRAQRVTVSEPKSDAAVRPHQTPPADRHIAKAPAPAEAPQAWPVELPPHPIALTMETRRVKSAARKMNVSPAAPGQVAPRPIERTSDQRAQLITRALPAEKPDIDSRITALAETRTPPRSAPVLVALNVPQALDGPEIRLPRPPRPVRATGEAAPPEVTLDPISPVKAARTRAVAADDRPAPAARPMPPADPTDDRAAPRIGPEDAALPARPIPRPEADRLAMAAPPVPLIIAPGVPTSPDSLSHRSVLQRPVLVKKMGGSRESEDAVERALLYLANTQQPDGRWTYITDRRVRRNLRKGRADIALTGLASLSYLAGGYTSAAGGKHRHTVARGLDYLVARQKSDGSLWESGGRMYGHAIATLALGEAAAMTGDEKYKKAAFKAAGYIIRAQHRSGGGWRYSPGERGDTSVVGWCVMALHSTERLGMKIPAKTRDGAMRYLNKVGGGRTRILAGYQNRGPTPAMSAEAAFSRMLLGQELTSAQQAELGSYLLREGRQRDNYYCWYYTSMAMLQLGGKPWEKWNPEMRDYLIKTQRRGGPDEGSWPVRGRWGGHNGAGKIYTTTMATLTLEVYYRYLPILGGKVAWVGKP